jgi:DNA-binding MarR family transcriptional regulator
VIRIQYRLFLRLWQLARRHHGYFSAHKIEAFGLTRLSWLILMVIGRFGPLSPAELADHTSVPADELSHIVTRLMKQGYVVRRQLSNSRRQMILMLTPKGRKAYKQLDNVARQIQVDVRRLNKSQRNELSNILATIETELDAILRKLRDVHTERTASKRGRSVTA